jgi:hypothetical protein
MQFRSFRVYGADKSHRKMIREMLPWAMEQLSVPERILSQVKFIVRMDAELLNDDNTYGQVCAIDGFSKPRHFEILLDKTLSDKQFAVTLFHELTHVKQYLMSELQDYKHTRLVRWKGSVLDPEFTDYWEQPWEKEAWKRASSLYRSYTKFKKKQQSI